MLFSKKEDTQSQSFPGGLGQCLLFCCLETGGSLQLRTMYKRCHQSGGHSTGDIIEPA